MKRNKYVFNNICQLFLIVQFTCTLSISANGQAKSNKSYLDIEIYGGQNENLYTDGSNLITIKTNDTVTKFTVKSSQGIVWQLDKYMFFVDSLQKGKTTITIFKTKLGE